MKINGAGAIPARVMLVGEAPSREEDERGEPFIGASGQELNRMLAEAGIMRSDCYLTNVCKFRPLNNDLANFIAKAKKYITPAHSRFRDKYVTKEVIEGYTELLAEIQMVQPNLIIAFGNLAMYALTGQWGVLKWRGSHLSSDGGIKVIPTIHPAAVLRQWELRPLVMTDLRRAKRHMTTKAWEGRPQWKFVVRPSFQQVAWAIEQITTKFLTEDPWIDFDIETKHGHIDSVGLSWSATDSICIPLYGRDDKAGYWSETEEAEIVYWLYKTLTHPRIRVRWQNGLYDAQYIHHHWNFIPRGVQDTMITQHSCFAALPKGLGFLGSMYADWYVYWKDEGKIASNEPEEKRWAYNCQDCVYTRTVGEALTDTAAALGLAGVDAQQQALFYPVLHAMLRGVRIIPERRDVMAREIQEELSSRQAFLSSVLGHTINTNSSPQMQALFYEDLKQAPVLKRVKQANGSFLMRPTCDDEALQKIAAREPLLKPVTNAIADIRTLDKFLQDFVLMPLDEDGRMRCSFNIAGDAGGKSAPYSYRLSSGKNAFGNGGNLQTIPSEKSRSAGKAAARGSMDFSLPNIRSMYGPDPGYTFFDMDLDRADLHPVAWESGDPLLKTALKLGADIHLINVYVLDNQELPPLEELVESHPKYWNHRGPRKYKREFAKTFGHATDYLGKAKTVAESTGRLVHEIDRAQKVYFGRYPGIPNWHERVRLQVFKHHFVENAFGYKWFIFDRIDEQILPKAVAWIPQSTVGLVINRIWTAFYNNLPEVQTLLQVHDSLAGQFPTFAKERLLPKMKELSKIVVPYPDPMIIPTGIKTSEVSWGDCE